MIGLGLSLVGILIGKGIKRFKKLEKLAEIVGLLRRAFKGDLILVFVYPYICLKNNKYLEINADPMRLDLPDSLVRDVVKLGVKLTLGTDTHEITMLDNMKYGVYVARRGWAEKKDIINTRSLKEITKMLQ